MNVYLTDILYHVSYVGQLLLKNFFHDDMISGKKQGRNVETFSREKFVKSL